jgi:hypothetical protein
MNERQAPFTVELDEDSIEPVDGPKKRRRSARATE